MDILKPYDRLVVAADFGFAFADTNGRSNWVRREVINLAKRLRHTRVRIKIHSPLRAIGFDLIREIQGLGLSVMADFKLFDISSTLANDGYLLNEVKPESVTVMCAAGSEAILALKRELPCTQVLGVTIPTSFSEASSRAIFGSSILTASARMTRIALEGEADGVVCSGKEAISIRRKVGEKMLVYAPGIRPEWSRVLHDDQNQGRVMTPEEAIKAGADRLIIGRPITQEHNPYDAVMRTIDEIERALELQVH